MKMAAVNYIILCESADHWTVRTRIGDRIVWSGKTFKGARTAHARLELIRKGVAPKEAARYARTMGNV